jgi:hypothetical protein
MPSGNDELSLSTLQPAQKRRDRKRIGRGMGSFQFFVRNSDRLGRELFAIQLFAISQNGGQPLGSDFVANPLDDLLGGKRLAEYGDRPLPTRFADHVAAGA